MYSRKIKVLFVCIHNSARSQMAEAFLNDLCSDFAVASSAGLEPGVLNPVVVAAMQEIGIDISSARTKGVLDLFKAGEKFDRVITVCDKEAAERCPLFPGVTVRLNWSFEDPSKFTGTFDEKLAATRRVRDAIKQQIESWCKEEFTSAQA